MFRPLSERGSPWRSRLLLVLLLACSDATEPRRHPSKLARPPQPPQLATAPGPFVRLIGAGDIASCDPYVTQDSETAVLVADYLAKWPDAIVYTTGDNTGDTGTAQEYADCYDPTWGRFKAKTRPSIGNHEYTLGNATPTFDYFGDLVGPRNLGYYSYDLGAWHVVVLNSNSEYLSTDPGSAQETWLKNDLAANTKACILAYWHNPRFYSTHHDNWGLSARMEQEWIDLYDAGATLVLNGDQHQYERYAPQDPQGNPTPRGIRQFIVGTGGRWGNAQPTAIAPNSEIQQGDVYGVLELQLGEGWYSWNFLPIPGSSFTDAGTGKCVDRGMQYPPIARAGGPYPGTAGSPVTLYGGGSFDPDGDLPLTYAWNFGDGTNGTGVTPTHSYAAAGNYTVTLTVTDAAGTTSIPTTTTAAIVAPLPPPSGSAVRLIGAGDIATCSTKYDSSTALLVSSYLARYPDAGVFTLGDNVMPNGTALNYSNCYTPTWGPFRAKTRPALGNHDYGAGNATASFDYFGALLGPRALGYYSYDVGSWHVVVLNSNTSYVAASAGSAQETWLKNDLALNTRPCILAYWHHPRFYSTTSGSYGLSGRMRQVWLDLYAAGATLVLNGDSHQYERYAPQDADGNPTTRGIRQFIVGTGGDWDNAQPTVIAPNSEVQKGLMYGVLELQLGDGWYTWNYLPIAGRTFVDAGTGRCVDRNAEYAPVARLGGPYPGTAGTPITMSASGSYDPDGDLPLTYAWDFGDGATGSGATATHVYTASGSFTVTLTVTDATGRASIPAATTATIVAQTNEPPVANAGGPYSGSAGTALTLDASASADPDGDLPLVYAWQFGDGATGTGVKPTHAYASAGSYTVSLVVTDARGLASAPATTTVTITSNQPPLANVGGPYSGVVGGAVAFDGSASSDPDGDLPLTFEWTFGDGGTGTGAKPTHSYSAPGSFTVRLVVTDAKGASSAPATATVDIAPLPNTAPVANVGGPYSGTAGSAVAFDGSGSRDADGDALTYAWSFGDGGAGIDVKPTHTYASAGTYTVSLTVTDARGLSSTAAITTATIAARPPTATARLIGAGDIGNCASTHPSETADQIAAYLTQHPDATVFTLGDNVKANATAQDYTNCYAPTWGRFKAVTRPSIGDEEYALGNATPTFDYFGALIGPRNLGYYSYDAGSWHIVVLNSQASYVATSLGSAQETWLKSDLASTTKPCILAYWHNPRFYSSTTSTPSVPSSRMRQVWIDLYAAGATLILNGDAHRYERFAPQDPDGNASARGIREFIVGTGGDYSGSTPTTLAPNSEVQKGSMYGVLELQLGDGWYSWNYMPIPGRTFSDAGTGACVSRSTAYAPLAPPVDAPGGAR